MADIVQIKSDKCCNCKRKSKSNLRHLGALCDKCFCKIIEKRVRKYVRVNKLFKKNDKIMVTDALCNYLVKSILKGLPVKLFYKKVNVEKLNDKNIKDFIKKNKINKVVVSWTADDEAQLLLQKVFHDKKEIKDRKIVKLLNPILDDEALLFSKFKKLQFKINKKDKNLKEFIDKVEKVNPGAVFGLMKSHKKMREFI